MAEVSTASAATEQTHKTFASKDSPSEGVMKGEGKQYAVFVYEQTGPVSKSVSDFLGEINLVEVPEGLQFEAVWITAGEIQLYVDIQRMMQQLDLVAVQSLKKDDIEEKIEQNLLSANGKLLKGEAPRLASPHLRDSAPKELSKPPVLYSSIFSMAKALSAPKLKTEGRKEEKREDASSIRSPHAAFSSPLASPRETLFSRSEKEQDKEKHEGKQEKQDQQEQQKEEKHHRPFSPSTSFEKNDEKKKKQRVAIAGIEAPTVASASSSSKSKLPSVQGNAASSSSKGTSSARSNGGGADNIYIRFMALMARILGQAEAEAHDLYKRIKQRTDDIDTLTLFVSKINSSKGKIDWAKDEEMKQLIEKVRAIGVDIPAGKYTWSEDEKKLLKENVQMKKDSMEKMTQMERTDMQRYLQEASQCHQARSNVLKQLKEVTDTIIANMRGG